jgi:hypothetical protein
MLSQAQPLDVTAKLNHDGVKKILAILNRKGLDGSWNLSY